MTDTEADLGQVKLLRLIAKFSHAMAETLEHQLVSHANNPIGFGWVCACIDNNREADWEDEQGEPRFHPWSPTVERAGKGGPKL